MTISVIIPAYNQGHYLPAAIESVLEQTRQDFELVVVDDGSTDDTAEAARRYSDPRVSYVFQSNAGLSAARNTGIRCTRGELVTFLDSDDLFAPKKLELLAGELEHSPQLGLVAGQAELIDENGQKLGITFDTPAPEDPAQLLLWNPLHVGSVMVRREWLERAGPFDESLRAYEDWDMWLRLARLGCSMGWVAAPVSLYRFHTRQMTQDRQRMTTATFAVLKKVYADPAISPEWRALKDVAYSNAYLRDALHAYRMHDTVGGREALGHAVRLDPSLAGDAGSKLASRLTALTDSPKIKDRLAFLELVYNHLPDNLSELSRQKNNNLASTAIQLGFEAYKNGNLQLARALLWRAVRYQPIWLTNRGVLSILLRTSAAGLFPSKEPLS